LRWITTGVIGPNGQRVHLEAARLAGKWVTAPGAIRRFVAAQPPTPRCREGPAPRSEAKRRRANDRVDRELDRAGI
jgi:hypothetical protein